MVVGDDKGFSRGTCDEKALALGRRSRLVSTLDLAVVTPAANGLDLGR